MFNPLQLVERTILITGASSGIGRETAIVLSNLGAKIILVARGRERLVEVERQLVGTGHAVEPCDLQDTESIVPWMGDLSARCGPVHGLVHSAGLQPASPLKFLKPSDLETTMRLNVGAGVALARGFIKQKQIGATGGSIVFIASVMGLVGEPGLSAYAASKGALIALSKSLAVELARQRVRVNCVVPGQVRTEMTGQMRGRLTAEQFAAIEAQHPLGLGEARDVAHAVAFLLADTGRWITGTSLIVDGGYTAR